MGDEIFLHGNLELKIIKARSLPFSVDCYVAVYLAGIRAVRTQVIRGSRDPTWNQDFNIPLAHPISKMEFQLKDYNILRSKRVIGVATVLAEMIAAGRVVDRWFQVTGPHTAPVTAIKLQIAFVPCQNNPIYQNGFSEKYEVKQSYFPLRHGGKVALYQDAHGLDGMLPEVRLDDGKDFEHQKCWEEMCHAISEARHLVYITGWSIYHRVRLVREPTKPLPTGGHLNLGELLEHKSRTGVKVVLLVWDDKTSHSKLCIDMRGIMKTHDEETRKFFKNSSVNCLLVPRFTSGDFSNFKQQALRALYTQHQKCVIVDTQGDGTNRKITAFLGGLDLCEGRYDTPEHRLFRDLNTVFKDDYHNPTFTSNVKAPRQPWHDLHCKLEGPAAYDVLTNFEQRWQKASETGQRVKRSSGQDEDVLFDIQNISRITKPTDHPSLWVSKEDDPEYWHIQVFRSIDSASLKGFPVDPHSAYEQNLLCDKRLIIDRSMEMAYIQAIRTAQRFIYIENQYFIGSSYAWHSHSNAGADNLIPMEIALKIATKIRANERFSVYIVIPMWPEGYTSSSSVKDILFWQRQTMKMMYEVIGEEIKSAQMENVHPTDYLNFYCLGNREEYHGDEDVGPSSFRQNRMNSASQEYGRFMIYVHSKGMIVDDEYVILGSANINQRSMAGSRDTEIAMGAYQPHYTTHNKDHPCGQVHGYRMSLWAEHTGSIERCFKDPASLECLKCINDTAENNWKRYTAEEFTPLQGHILKYPIQVHINGQVTPLPGYHNFPDVGCPIEGARSRTLPRKLTT